MSEALLMTNLSVQSWLQKMIQQPQTQPNSLHEVIDESYGISAQQRLAIYQNGYMLRLLECMRAEYPLLIRVFSEAWFDAIAQRYLAFHPSCSTNLNDLGKQFPAFLEQDRPDKHQNDSPDQVFELIVSIAKFERFKVETSRGKGSEDADTNPFDLIDQNALNIQNIVLAPNLRLLKTPFQLLEYLQEVKNDQEQKTEATLVQQTQYIVFCRENYQVHTFTIDEWQYELLLQLQNNNDFSAVLTQLNTQFPHDSIFGFAPFFLDKLQNQGCLLSIG